MWVDLGFHIFDLLNKVICRFTSWLTKHLINYGRFLLIKHVVQALPIHLLSAITSPFTLIKQIEMLIEDFYWGWKSDKKKYHWAPWKNFSYPIDEGGVGMINIKYVCLAIQYKQWWILITKHTLWGDFIKAK